MVNTLKDETIITIKNGIDIPQINIRGQESQYVKGRDLIIIGNFNTLDIIKQSRFKFSGYKFVVETETVYGYENNVTSTVFREVIYLNGIQISYESNVKTKI